MPSHACIIAIYAMVRLLPQASQTRFELGALGYDVIRRALQTLGAASPRLICRRCARLADQTQRCDAKVQVTKSTLDALAAAASIS
jgi:hypothetical protein